jgi:hypothetical protein
MTGVAKTGPLEEPAKWRGAKTVHQERWTGAWQRTEAKPNTPGIAGGGHGCETGCGFTRTGGHVGSVHGLLCGSSTKFHDVGGDWCIAAAVSDGKSANSMPLEMRSDGLPLFHCNPGGYECAAVRRSQLCQAVAHQAVLARGKCRDGWEIGAKRPNTRLSYNREGCMTRLSLMATVGTGQTRLLVCPMVCSCRCLHPLS